MYGKSSTAIGTSNTVSVKNSSKSAFAIGDANQATAKMTFALGDYNKVTKAYSFAIGSTNTVNANTSIAIGCWLKNTVDHGITIGFGNQKSLPLVNNTDGIMMGMNSDKPTFFISSSSCDGGTGRVGIGNVTSPQAKLHIKADNYSYDGEDADILLEPTRANKIAVIYFRDMSNSISVFANQMTFAAPKYSFTNAGITLGKNTSTQAPEISFGGQGGGMTYTFMKALGGKIGNSICEDDKLDLALDIIAKAKEKGVKLVLSIQTLAGNKFGEDSDVKIVDPMDIPDGWEGMDIGPKTGELFAEVIKGSKTILWNGPVGVFEFEKFTGGSRAVANAIVEATEAGAFSLIGGGDSVACINKFGLADKVSYVSTGGGALLEAIEGKELPGIAAIKK